MNIKYIFILWDHEFWCLSKGFMIMSEGVRNMWKLLYVLGFRFLVGIRISPGFLADFLVYQFTLVQLLIRVWHFATPCTAAHQASLSLTNSWSLLKLMSIESVMLSNHLLLCRPSLIMSSVFPASGSFPESQFFASGGQNIGVSASASVLQMNIQDGFPLRWTGWISLQSKGLSGVFSNTTVQKHQFFNAQLSL